MRRILLLDTAVASLNKGDDIIMACVREELADILQSGFVLNVPTHLTAFTALQQLVNSPRLRIYEQCDLKFVGGTNLLVNNLRVHFPQWNINSFNYRALAGSILVGVGKGSGETSNKYTSSLYRKVLSHRHIHSVRDERTASFLHDMGLQALNTACVTMWKLTPAFCASIPRRKAVDAVFTLNEHAGDIKADQYLIDILLKSYQDVYFWPQAIYDLDYLKQLQNISGIQVLQANLASYDALLSSKDLDYIGLRLHGGIYAMRHRKRALIISVDERAAEISRDTGLRCVGREELDTLEPLIFSAFETRLVLPFEHIAAWKAQFTQEVRPHE